MVPSMKRCMIRPGGFITALLMLFAVLFSACVIVPAVLVISGDMQIIHGSGPTSPDTWIVLAVFSLLPIWFFYMALAPGVAVYDDRMVITSQKTTGIRLPKRTIWYRDIAYFKTGLMDDAYTPGTVVYTEPDVSLMTDVLYLHMIDGSEVAVDLEVYSDERVGRLVWELMVCTNIWPGGRVRPREHSDSAWIRVLRPAGSLIGVLLIFLILPVSTIWLEAWINPAHPTNYQSGWRTGYMLCAMFAGLIVIAAVLAWSRARQLSNGIDLNPRHHFYRRLAVATSGAAVVLYGAALALFLKSALF